MMELSRDIVHFLQKQGFVLVASLDEKGRIHCAAKGIVGIEPEGRIFVADLYLRHTYRNLKRDNRVSITAVDEHHFKGYTIQGRARIVPREEIQQHIMAKWEERIIQRISRRVVRGVQARTKAAAHFEAHLPSQPQYLIEVDAESIIDLAPPALK